MIYYFILISVISCVVGTFSITFIPCSPGEQTLSVSVTQMPPEDLSPSSAQLETIRVAPLHLKVLPRPKDMPVPTPPSQRASEVPSSALARRRSSVSDSLLSPRPDESKLRHEREFSVSTAAKEALPDTDDTLRRVRDLLKLYSGPLRLTLLSTGFSWQCSALAFLLMKCQNLWILIYFLYVSFIRLFWWRKRQWCRWTSLIWRLNVMLKYPCGRGFATKNSLERIESLFKNSKKSFEPIVQSSSKNNTVWRRCSI